MNCDDCHKPLTEDDTYEKVICLGCKNHPHVVKTAKPKKSFKLKIPFLPLVASLLGIGILSVAIPLVILTKFIIGIGVMTAIVAAMAFIWFGLVRGIYIFGYWLGLKIRAFDFYHKRGAIVDGWRVPHIESRGYKYGPLPWAL